MEERGKGALGYLKPYGHARAPLDNLQCKVHWKKKEEEEEYGKRQKKGEKQTINAVPTAKRGAVVLVEDAVDISPDNGCFACRK